MTMTLDMHDSASPDAAPRKINASARILPGEDAALGAFRFAEEYTLWDIDTVMNVMEELDGNLPEGYEPDEELVPKCGKRACSAGKLWKRADGLRKADIWDGSGSDLLRALKKKVRGCDDDASVRNAAAPNS